MSDENTNILQTELPQDSGLPGSPKTVEDLGKFASQQQSDKNAALARAAEAEKQLAELQGKQAQVQSYEDLENSYGDIVKQHTDALEKEWIDNAVEQFGSKEAVATALQKAEALGLKDAASTAEPEELAKMAAMYDHFKQNGVDQVPNQNTTPQGNKNMKKDDPRNIPEDANPNLMSRWGGETFYAHPTPEGLDNFMGLLVTDEKTGQPRPLVDVNEASAMNAYSNAKQVMRAQGIKDRPVSEGEFNIPIPKVPRMRGPAPIDK